MSPSSNSSDAAEPTEYNAEQVDEVTMALMYLTIHAKSAFGARAWKGFDCEALNRLHAKRLIENPKSTARSVTLSPEAVDLADEFSLKYFGNITCA